MAPFKVVADLDDGRFAVLSIDPTKHIGDGCSAIVISIHDTKPKATAALESQAA